MERAKQRFSPDDLAKLEEMHAERFYRRQRGFTVFKTVEDLFIKMQLEFCVYLPKCLIQHGENPPVG